MYEYEPTIKADDYSDTQIKSDPAPMLTLDVARAKQDSNTKNQTDIVFCSVSKLWLETPGKKGPEDEAFNNTSQEVPPAAKSRWNFAPKEEKVKICWELKGRLTSDKKAFAHAVELKLELFIRKSTTAFWTKTIKWKTGECPVRGETEFNGLLVEDQFRSATGKTTVTDDVTIHFIDKTKFTDNLLTVDQSPYKLKLSIVNAGDPRYIPAKWIFFDILVHSLELKWGDANMLSKTRPDISDPRNLSKVVGRAPDPSKAGDTGTKGYEEKILEDLRSEKADPVSDFVHKIKLDSNLFPFQRKNADNVESFASNTDFITYKGLWGNGARVPLLVNAFIRTSVKDGKTDKVPEALGNAKIIWDWEEKIADRWKTAVAGTTCTKSDQFLDPLYKKNDPFKPKAGSNCPKDFGGKHGDDTGAGLVFPEQNVATGFPFEVKKSVGRKWSSLSSFGTDEKRGSSGVIFQPARFAGDQYKIKGILHFDRYADDETDIQAAVPVQTNTCEFKVFRRVQLNSLVRGRAELKFDPANLDSQIASDYLQEFDMELEPNPVDVDNNNYKIALRAGIDRLCAGEHFPELRKTIPNLSLIARFAINMNPPDDSAAVVYKDWTILKNDLNQAIANDRMRVAVGMAGFYQGEVVTGQVSNAIGNYLRVNGVDYILFAAAQAFHPNEKLLGKDSNKTASFPTGNMKRSCKSFSCNETAKTERDDSVYKEHVEVLFPGNPTPVKLSYQKKGLKLVLSADLAPSETSKLEAAFDSAWGSHDEANDFIVEIRGRNDTDNAQNRLNNVKIFLETLLTRRSHVDRSKALAAVTQELKTAFSTVIKNPLKSLALHLIGEITWEYANRFHPNVEGVFVLHAPGQFKGYVLDPTNDTSTPFKVPKVQGAVYPELTGAGNGRPFESRDRSIAYLATVKDNVADSTETKPPKSVYKHELAHALFLPHAPTVTGKNLLSPRVHCHVKDDTCVMNYDLDSNHFCGRCILRVRGWDWRAEHFPNTVKAVKIGEGTGYLTADGTQYVNLAKDDKWVVPGGGTKDRLGRKISVTVEFDPRTTGADCTVQLLGHCDNVVYSDQEKGRKAEFAFKSTASEMPSGDFELAIGDQIKGTRDPNNEFKCEIELPPGVGDRYKVVAWGEESILAESVMLTTWRQLFYMVLKYAHPNSVGTPAITAAIDNAFLRNFTKWIFAGEKIMPNIRNFLAMPDSTHAATTNAVRNETNAACSAIPGKQYPDFDPFLMRIAQISQCIKPQVIKTTPVRGNVGTGSPSLRIQVRNQPDDSSSGTVFDLRKSLHHNQGSNEDVQKPLVPNSPINQYFVSGTVSLLRQSLKIQIDGKVTTAGNVEVKLTSGLLAHSPKTLSIPVALDDKSGVVGGKIRQALSADAEIATLFNISGESYDIVLIRKNDGVDDGNLDISVRNATCAGLTDKPNGEMAAAGVRSKDGAMRGVEIPLDFQAITPVAPDPNRPSAYLEADVVVNNLTLNGAPIRQQVGEVSLEVYVLFKFVNGMARLKAPQANGIIVMPAASNFKNNSAGGQLNAIVHEMGHAIGMAANPTEVGVDSHKYHYNLNGDHCRNGLADTAENTGPTYQTLANQDAPGLCVMFGFTSNINPRLTFCAACEASMRKINVAKALL